jgi:mannosidase alpha-like ER degradation enhancer 1
LWKVRSKLGLLGSTIDNNSLRWLDENSGIGAGIDSFFEYLYKTYILTGKYPYWKMFTEAYDAAITYYKKGPWYVDVNMRTGNPTHYQFNSLQAFWPGLQVLVGDIPMAKITHNATYGLWKRFHALPERYMVVYEQVHSTEKYYPLRPEVSRHFIGFNIQFMESTFLLYQATHDPFYLEVGREIYYSINNYTKVLGGFASIRDVDTRELEDRMNSFFLAETCKYLYLLYL